MRYMKFIKFISFLIFFLFFSISIVNSNEIIFSDHDPLVDIEVTIDILQI